MRPRLLTDEMILTAIRDLAARGRVTGTALRALLLQRYGAKGSVGRVYRHLQAAAARRVALPVREPPLAADPQTLQEARARAALAEERERVHQARWAREIDALRARLAEADHSSREVAALRLRVAQLQGALDVAREGLRTLESTRPAAAPPRSFSPT